MSTIYTCGIEQEKKKLIDTHITVHIFGSLWFSPDVPWSSYNCFMKAYDYLECDSDTKQTLSKLKTVSKFHASHNAAYCPESHLHRCFSTQCSISS